jgi:hypothetical protein
MGAPTFDASAPIIRYVSASASGSANGTAIGAPWTWAQLDAAAASQALDGADVWFTGDANIATPVLIRSGGGFASRKFRLLAYNATPGDVTDDLMDGTARPTLTATSAIANGATFFRFQREFAEFYGARLRSANTLNMIRHDSTNISGIALDVQTPMNTSGYPQIVSGGGRFVRCIFTGAALGPAASCHECYMDAVDGGASGWGATYTNCIIARSPQNDELANFFGCFLAGLQGARRFNVVKSIIDGPMATAANKVLIESTFFRTSGNTLAQVAGANGYADVQELAGSAIISLASRDFRLSAIGRTNRRCVETMLGLASTPVPSGVQRDDAATLDQYLAELNGFRRSLSFSIGGF